MDLTDKQVTEKFAAFEKNQDPTLVHEALDMIEATERDIPAETRRHASRRYRGGYVFLLHWIGILTQSGI